MSYDLPTSIDINGTPFKIRENGDFRMVFDCFSVLNATDLTNFEKVATSLIIFYEDIKSVEDVQHLKCVEELLKKMYSFFNCNDEMRSNTSNVSLIDWDKDRTLICAAINNVANKEIRAEKYLHWWTFVGYYMSIGECPLSNILNIRYKKAKGKKLEKYESQFVSDNPQYFQVDTRSAEQKEIENTIRGMWDS